MPDLAGPDSASFSDGVDRLLNHVRPHGRPSTAFPVGLDGAKTRREAGESLRAWFRRLVDDFGDKQQAQVIAQIKRTLRASKDSLFGDQMNGLDRTILEYPATE